jgi:hypothetical protein
LEIQHLCALVPRSSPFDVFFHLHTHRQFLKVESEQVLSGSLQILKNGAELGSLSCLLEDMKNISRPKIENTAGY